MLKSCPVSTHGYLTFRVGERPAAGTVTEEVWTKWSPSCKGVRVVCVCVVCVWGMGRRGDTGGLPTGTDGLTARRSV